MLFLTLFSGIGRADYSLPPDKLNFAALQPPSAMEIVDRNDKILTYWVQPQDKFLLYRPSSQIYERLGSFIVLLEDAKFYQHNGLDWTQIRKSLAANVKAGRVKRGGSTITQQLVKNLFLDKKRSMLRKLYEVPWTKKVEEELSKKQILELYLNIIEWGPGIYGAEAASRHYFDKTAQDINDNEALYLALVVPSPVRFDNYANPKYKDFLSKKKSTFLKRLVEVDKKMTPEEREALEGEPFGMAPTQYRKYPLFHTSKKYPSVRNSQLQESLSKLKGKPKQEKTYVSTLDFQMQKILESMPSITKPQQPARFAVLVKDQKVRAIRWLQKNQALMSAEDNEAFQLSEWNDLSWDDIKGLPNKKERGAAPSPKETNSLQETAD